MASDWLDRAIEKTEKDPSSGCWLYQGEIVHNGYGRIWYGDRNVRVHRLSYLRFRGKIPSGLLVCHKCDVRNCWNPDHLFVGTVQDNTDDMMRKGRGSGGSGHHNIPKGNNVHCSKLDDEKVRRIRHLSSVEKLSQRRIAQIYSVNKTTIRNVVLGKVWAHVDTQPSPHQSTEGAQ